MKWKQERKRLERYSKKTFVSVRQSFHVCLPNVQRAQNHVASLQHSLNPPAPSGANTGKKKKHRDNFSVIIYTVSI